MAGTYKLRIYVDEITNVLANFDYIRIYVSTTGLEVNRSFYASLSLVAGQTTYEYDYVNGEDTYVAWFTYYNSLTHDESAYSAAFQFGDTDSEFASGFYFLGKTYPAEMDLNYSQNQTVESIRRMIGDIKEVKRDYANSVQPTLYANVQNDGYTYCLSDSPGWPLKVILDNTEYTSLLEPTVRGYNFVTFSGVSISTVSGILDIWYEKFRHSDREILYTYYYTDTPSPLTSSQVTDEIKKVAAAVALMESELRALTGRVDGSFSVSQDTTFNPNPVLQAKLDDLEKLRDKLDKLVDEACDYGIFGLSGIRIE